MTLNCEKLLTQKKMFPFYRVTLMLSCAGAEEMVYFIDDTRLQEIDVVKDLGVFLDGRMTFVPHIECMVGRASKLLGFVIRNVKAFKRPSTKITLYNNIVRSVLEYGCVVWRPHYA
ncbi:unnamed protein product [Euphydryas editha]|uniref:Uncharacterized protein n=1 Tax=Euphydryas editha TaxID=104508 RepID=A0AAU9U325_EUPED|nr:unnamed protein product [Euphydryas editha]